eukprot:scaffold8904_cov90-Skeletonema_marinoi.AAC.3
MQYPPDRCLVGQSCKEWLVKGLVVGADSHFCRDSERFYTLSRLYEEFWDNKYISTRVTGRRVY